MGDSKQQTLNKLNSETSGRGQTGLSKQAVMTLPTRERDKIKQGTISGGISGTTGGVTAHRAQVPITQEAACDQ